MARPKKGTKAGDKASARWRATVRKKYGGKKGVHEMMQMIGSKGGQAKTSKPKGFAKNRDLAVLAGAIGGRKSRRTGVSTGQGKTKEYIWNGGENEDLVFAREESETEDGRD